MGRWSGQEVTPLSFIIAVIYLVGIPYGLGYLIALLIGNPDSTGAIGTILMGIWVVFLGPFTMEWLENNVLRKVKRRRRK